MTWLICWSSTSESYRSRWWPLDCPRLSLTFSYMFRKMRGENPYFTRDFSKISICLATHFLFDLITQVQSNTSYDLAICIWCLFVPFWRISYLNSLQLRKVELKLKINYFFPNFFLKSLLFLFFLPPELWKSPDCSPSSTPSFSFRMRTVKHCRLFCCSLVTFLSIQKTIV